MNKLLAIALSAAALFLSPGCSAAEPTAKNDRPPNVVIFFTDDMGYADLSSYDSKVCTTPNLDALAKRGVRFTSFYVSEAVCSASRSSIMTGCYAQRVGIRGALGPRSKHGLHPDETTLGELVKPLGYATCAIGKWHLGHLPQHLPTSHGFDEYLGLPYSNDMWPWHYGDQDRGFIGSPHWKNAPPLPIIEGTETIETNPRQDSLTPRYTERALDFIDRSKDSPFLLYFAYSHPHVPIAASDKFRGKSGNGLYADMIAEIDDSVGQVVKRLETHGLTDNALRQPRRRNRSPARGQGHRLRRRRPRARHRLLPRHDPRRRRDRRARLHPRRPAHRRRVHRRRLAQTKDRWQEPRPVFERPRKRRETTRHVLLLLRRTAPGRPRRRLEAAPAPQVAPRRRAGDGRPARPAGLPDHRAVAL
jgi:hypothetical protein